MPFVLLLMNFVGNRGIVLLRDPSVLGKFASKDLGFWENYLASFRVPFMIISQMAFWVQSFVDRN